MQIFEKIGCHSDDVGSRPSHSSESIAILEPKGKTDFLIAV